MIGVILAIFLAIGVFFNLLASVGILRFPDVYTRIHASTKCTTFGTIFIVLATITYALYNWRLDGNSKWVVLAIHASLVVIFLVLTNPVGAHAIGRAARKSDIRPYGAVIDKLEGYYEL